MQSLLDELDELIFVSDIETHEIYYMNKSALQYIEINGNPNGKKCYEVLKKRSTPCEYCVNSLLSFEKSYEREIWNQYYGKLMILKDKLIYWKGKRAKLEIAQDKSQMLIEESTAKEQLKVEQLLIKCIRIINSTEILREGFLTALEVIGTYFEADRAFIYELDSAGVKIHHSYEWHSDRVQPRMKEFSEMATEYIPIWLNLSKDKNISYLSDISIIRESFNEIYEFLKQYQVTSLMTFTFMSKGGIVGTIGLDNPQNRNNAADFLEPFYYFAMDEAQKKRMRLKLEYMSYYDELTHLGNRRKLQILSENLKIKNISETGVLFLDINEMAMINNISGHKYGDQIMIETANELCITFPKEYVFRNSGDEFIVVYPEVSQLEFTKMAEQLIERFEVKHHYTVSIGYNWKNEVSDIYHLIQDAQAYMKINKKYYYDTSASTVQDRRRSSRNKLKSEIQNGNFVMYLQPKIDIKTKSLIGAEALVRYIQKDKTVVSPGAFIPRLESERIIEELDFFILEEVCCLLESWHQRGIELIKISLNFSRITLLWPELSKNLDQILQKYNFPVEFLEIEITESDGEVESSSLILMGNCIKQKGLGLSLDDFGAKYSNLSILASVDFDMLKLDKTLIEHIESSEKNKLVVQGVIATSKMIGIQSLAEGVETKEQFEMLNDMNCDLAQGYLFGKPVSVTEFEQKWILKSS